MRRAMLLLVGFVSASWLGIIVTPEGLGDVVWLKNGERREGLVIAVSASALEIADRIELSDRQVEIIDSNEVETWLRTIDLARLEKLDPQFPQAYLEFADELSRFPHDRLAAELMRRLYLIALTLDDAEIRQSARLALEKLLSPEDKQILDAFHSPQSLDEAEHRTRLRFVATRDDLDGLLTLLASTRREDWDRAEKLIQEPRIRSAQQNWSRIVSWGELVETVSRRQLTNKRWLLIMRLEEAVGDAIAPMEVDDAPENWLATGWLPAQTETPVSRFIERFGFDPTASVFQDGRWVHPTLKAAKSRSENSP